jgi:hypothetical protein
MEKNEFQEIVDKVIGDLGAARTQVCQARYKLDRQGTMMRESVGNELGLVDLNLEMAVVLLRNALRIWPSLSVKSEV